MKCFYHEEKDAVATCTVCGKALCKECAAAHTPCICADCYESRQKSEQQEKQAKYRDALIDTTTEFTRACVLGLVVGMVTVSIIIESGLPLPMYLVYFLLSFTVPFGWKLITYLQSFFRFFLIAPVTFWIAWYIFKFMMSMFIGIPAFLYQLFKTMKVQKELERELEHME